MMTGGDTLVTTLMRKFVAISAVLLILLASGCMYPGSRGSQGTISTGEFIVLVENAIDNYEKRTGVLPIYNSSLEAPMYEKYRVNFKLLKDYHLLGQIPPDAFEEGGYYYYMIVGPDREDRMVKLLDVRVSQAVSDVQREVDGYFAKEGRLPVMDMVKPQFYSINYETLNMKLVQARSVYSGHYLSYILHESGAVAIDYAADVMQAIRQAGEESPDPSIDLRRYLLEQSPFIPVASYPYYWVDGEPTIGDSGPLRKANSIND